MGWYSRQTCSKLRGLKTVKEDYSDEKETDDEKLERGYMSVIEAVALNPFFGPRLPITAMRRGLRAWRDYEEEEDPVRALNIFAGRKTGTE